MFIRKLTLSIVLCVVSVSPAAAVEWKTWTEVPPVVKWKTWSEEPSVIDPLIEQLNRETEQFHKEQFESYGLDYGIFEKNVGAAQDYWECLTKKPLTPVIDHDYYCLSVHYGRST